MNPPYWVDDRDSEPRWVGVMILTVVAFWIGVGWAIWRAVR